MLDVTKEERTFVWKEFAVNVLIAIMPASVLIVITNQLLGVTGAVVPLLFIFGGEVLVGKIRKKKGYIATNKSILWALGANLVFFIILPVVLIAITDLSS